MDPEQTMIRRYKLGFNGQGLCPWTPLKPFLKEGFKNPKNFHKILSNNLFLKVLEGGWGELLSRSSSQSLPYKLKFFSYLPKSS